MMQAYLELAEHGDAPSKIITDLKARKMMPFFFSDKDLDTKPANWQKFLHPAHSLQGSDSYYYSYIANSKKYQIFSHYLSYEAFLLKQK